MTPTTTKTMILAVMYHYVHHAQPILASGVGALSVGDFRDQIDLLCRTMEPIDWPSLVGWMEGRVSLPDRCFLLTFDDGLSDHARHVLPVLQGRGLHGVFFVPTAVFTGQTLLSAHAIHMLLARVGDDRFREDLFAYLDGHNGGRDWRKEQETDDATALYHYETEDRAKLKYLLTVTLPIRLRDAAVRHLFEIHIGTPRRWASDLYLSWNDLIEMRSMGHTIGGHGHRHEPYTRLSPIEQREDIHRAASVLNSGLGPDVRPFSYPYGRYDADTQRFCRSAGFSAGFTTETGFIAQDADPFQLARVDTIDVNTVCEREFSCRQP